MAVTLKKTVNVFTGLALVFQLHLNCVKLKPVYGKSSFSSKVFVNTAKRGAYPSVTAEKLKKYESACRKVNALFFYLFFPL